MPDLYPCERVGLELINTARFRSTNSVDLAITPAQLWHILGEAESWPRWSPLTRMTWTSPAPFRLGSTRAVEMRNGGAALEEVIAWQPHSHLAFRMNKSSTDGACIGRGAPDRADCARLPADMDARARPAKPAVTGQDHRETRDDFEVPRVPGQAAPVHRPTVRHDDLLGKTPSSTVYGHEGMRTRRP